MYFKIEIIYKYVYNSNEFTAMFFEKIEENNIILTHRSHYKL